MSGQEIYIYMYWAWHINTEQVGSDDDQTSHFHLEDKENYHEENCVRHANNLSRHLSKIWKKIELIFISSLLLS